MHSSPRQTTQHQWLVLHSPCSDSYPTLCRDSCGEHHVIKAESYYEETTESDCDTCHKGDHPSGPSMAPPSKGTKAPMGTPAPPPTRGTKAPKGTPAPTTTQKWATTAAPVTSTAAPTTSSPYMPPNFSGSTTAVPATTAAMTPGLACAHECTQHGQTEHLSVLWTLRLQSRLLPACRGSQQELSLCSPTVCTPCSVLSLQQAHLNQAFSRPS